MEPDENAISQNCAVMRINYNVTDNKNWETTACSTDQNGQLGKSHGFVCVEDKDWKALENGDCAVIFPTTTTTTTTTKTATTSSGSGPEVPDGSGEGQSSELLIQIVWIITGSVIAFSYTLIGLFIRRYSRSQKSSHIFWTLKKGSTTQTSLTTSTKDPTDPNPDPNNPDNSSTSSSSTATTTTTTTLESEDVNVGIIIGGVLGGLLFLERVLFDLKQSLND